MRRSFAVVLWIAAVVAAPLYAQEQYGGGTDAEEYSEEEFSPVLRDLRRAEIIMLGSFPLTLFVSLELYDLYRYAESGGDYQYAPWPFRPPDAAGYSSRENVGVFLSALSASLLIAAADYVIGRVREKRADH